MLLGEGLSLPAGFPAREAAELGLMILLMAAYFFLCGLWLSRGNAQAARPAWPTVLGLSWTMGFATVIALCFEPNKSAVLLLAGFTLLCALCAWAGAAVAARAARPRAP